MIGLDVVDVERLRRRFAEDPGLPARLFTEVELSYCGRRADPVVHLAGTLAAKEAVIKAAHLGSLVGWARRIEITRDADGAPNVSVAARADVRASVTISHDGGWAAAAALSL